MKSTVVPEIDVHELQRLRAEGSAPVLWDVRTSQEYATEHVPGARNLPFGSAALASAVREPRGQAAVYLICASGGRSKQACAQVFADGVSPAFSVAGGTRAWSAAGYPTERSSGGGGVISLERQVRIGAGLLVLSGVIAGTWLHTGFYALAGFVGAGLVFAGVTDWCGMGLLIARLPWNQR